MLERHFARQECRPEQRRTARKPWVIGLTVWFEDPCTPLLSTRAIDVTTLNVSKGGVSFLSERFIGKGLEVRACFNALPDQPTLAGMVRSCEYLGGTCHRIGVEFDRPT